MEKNIKADVVERNFYNKYFIFAKVPNTHMQTRFLLARQKQLNFKYVKKLINSNVGTMKIYRNGSCCC